MSYLSYEYDRILQNDFTVSSFPPTLKAPNLRWNDYVMRFLLLLMLFFSFFPPPLFLFPSFFKELPFLGEPGDPVPPPYPSRADHPSINSDAWWAFLLLFSYFFVPLYERRFLEFHLPLVRQDRASPRISNVFLF